MPARAVGNKYGALVIDSMPPATITSPLPVWIACAASPTAFRPDPQTLLIVMAATLSGNPPRSAACRAGFCPRPAETTFPMTTSSICAGSTPARDTASRTEMAPSCGAVRGDKTPWNLPIGVRTADRITGVSIAHFTLGAWYRQYYLADGPRGLLSRH